MDDALVRCSTHSPASAVGAVRERERAERKVSAVDRSFLYSFLVEIVRMNEVYDVPIVESSEN